MKIKSPVNTTKEIDTLGTNFLGKYDPLVGGIKYVSGRLCRRYKYPSKILPGVEGREGRFDCDAGAAAASRNVAGKLSLK